MGLEEDARTRAELTSQYRTLLETSTDGFFVNVRGAFRYVNPAFARLVGAASAQQLLGRVVFDFIDPASHAAVRERIRAMQSNTDPVAPLEEKYVRLDGSHVDVEVTAVAIVQDGEHAMLVTVRDISKRKEAERARVRLEEQLRQAQKMEALGTLAGGVAHDFNNILAAIVGNTERLRLRVAKEQAADRYLSEILSAAARAKGLTRQILAFSRPEPPRLDVLDLAAVVGDELQLLRAASPVGATLAAELEPGTYPVLADATQMHQVLLNLCTNAWQAFHGGAGQVTVGLRKSTVPGSEPSPLGLAPGRYAVLSVRDDGPGVDDSIVARIFDPFFTTKAPGQGTGLGLSVVHGIAEGHGARIVCDSLPAHGTTFRLFMPLVSQEPASEHPRHAEPPPGHGERILLLDDEPALVQTTCELLTSRGYRVSGFTSPREALDKMRESPTAFDLLVTDLKMPGHTGIDLANAARQLEPPLPVILLSGYLEEDVRQRARELDVRRVLHKPVAAAELCLAIAEALVRPA